MKTKLLFIFTSIFILNEALAQVTLPYYEGFNYAEDEKLITAGASSGLGDWVLFNDTGDSSDPETILSPAWSLPAGLPAAMGNAVQYVGGGDDPIITIPDQGSSGLIYSSFIFKVTDQSAVTINNPGYFYSFAKTSSSGTSLNYTSCVYLDKIDATTFNIGISENNNTTNAVWTTTPLSVNQDIFVVISYNIDTATSSIWIDPVINPTEPAASYVTNETDTSTRNNLDKVRLSLESNAKIPTINLDEIRIGNTWESVVTNAPLSVSQNELENQINIYPNPARDQVSISAKTDIQFSSVVLYDVLGKRVFEQEELKTNSIDVSQLKAGMYFMKINLDNKSVTKKIIID